MNVNDVIKAVTEGGSIGFEIARKFFNWNNLSQSDIYFRASNVLYLARLIDEAFEKEEVE